MVPLVKFSETLQSGKRATPKSRTSTVSKILKDAYRRHCRDQVTRKALRQCLKD